MEKINDHINLLILTSSQSKNHFLNKEQLEIARFVYCAIQKLSKVSFSLRNLYSDPDEFSRFEFGIGILCRSVLMDMILVMEIKHICYTNLSEGFESIKEKIKTSCYKFLGDGTEHLVKNILANDKYSKEEKDQLIKNFTNLFNKAFDSSADNPKLKKDYRFSLAEIIKATKHELNVTGEDIVDLYSFYSKYDHLSHWTSLAQKFDIAKRLARFETSLRLMILHLRDLLAIAFDFEDYKMLLPYLDDLSQYLSSLATLGEEDKPT